MITNWEELGDTLAEFESRLLLLENSQPYSGEEHLVTHTPEPELTPQRIYLNIDRKSLELQKRISLLESFVEGLRAKANRKRKHSLELNNKEGGGGEG